MSSDQPKPKSSKELPSLPPSDDPFWEGAEVSQVVAEKLEPAPEHLVQWEGPYAVCTSCPYRHTIPVDFTKFDIVEGRLVKKSKNSSKPNA